MKQGPQWKIFILLFAWTLVFWPVLPPMVEAWLSHSDNSHALLVPFISLYFAWGMREELTRIPLTPSVTGGVVLLISLLLYLVSLVGGIVVTARIMLVASLIGLIWCCLGGAMVRRLAFPLGFLFFMIPVPVTLLGMISFPLQMIATKISAGVISFCSIPVYREGNMLYFVNTQLEVAEACSGIRSIMSMVMLSVIFAYMATPGWWRKFALVLSAIPIAMLANIVRVSGTGVLAHFWGDQVARGFMHDFSGMAVFAFGLIVLFIEFSLINRIKAAAPAERSDNKAR
ncbi:exosortase A [Desulfuromonas sp. AOP6]|uniref:exosortase A n=1 Tax=Desulfuromonas sp. AOP6 TaxID=1566351 RepID=UPI00128920CC|nr:exosortase A [Desulfuromonas sp. AOP6]BCA79492.1 exosortase [Desulfuromonas sp. AOP6]